MDSLILSFAWTTPAFLAGRKTRTRRDWTERHALAFCKRVGQVVDAWDHVPRVKGAKRVGYAKILGVKRESISLMPEEDYEREGFAFMEEKGLKIWGKEPRQAFDEWKAEGGFYWVVDFVKVEKPT